MENARPRAESADEVRSWRSDQVARKQDFESTRRTPPAHARRALGPLWFLNRNQMSSWNHLQEMIVQATNKVRAHTRNPSASLR
jgi:hypothetical protein